MAFQTMSQVKSANGAIGNHWFSDGAMHFFRSRVESPLIGGRYFVSSEQFVSSSGESSPRRYTVRVVDEDGSVDTEGEFQAYRTEREARAAIYAALHTD